MNQKPFDILKASEALPLKVTEILDKEFMSSAMYTLTNLYLYSWESDFIKITKGGFVYEVEIKLTHSDFEADFKKEGKHKLFKVQYDRTNSRWSSVKKEGIVNCPNYFYFATLEGVIAKDEVPVYAGLIYVYPEKKYIQVVKEAPRLNVGRINSEGLNLEYKMYRMMTKWRDAALKAYRGDSTKKAVEGVREAGLAAFQRSCPSCRWEGGCPMCDDPSVESSSGTKDCFMQCQKGREFRKYF